MRVVANGAYGVHVGQDSSVRRSTVKQSGNAGILCGARCFVEDSNSSGNDAEGIRIFSGMVLGDVIIGNDGLGIQGDTMTGFGNNTLAFNNGGSPNPQVDGVVPLHPNACVPACP
jgi:hypothetical protein